MFQFLRSQIKDPNTLRQEELEPTFIDLKNTILAKYPSSFNSASDDPSFRRLFSRIEMILGRILSRHERYVVDVETAFNRWAHPPLFIERPGNPWDQKVYSPNKNLNLVETKSEILFYMCFFAYYGGIAKDVGTIKSDPTYAIEVLDNLIQNRDFAPAIFFKGLIYKYGLYPDLPPKLTEAKSLLDTAAAKGIGGAVIELRQFDIHERTSRYNWR